MEAQALTRRRRIGVLLICSTSLLIVGLDITAVNVALPALQAQLGASVAEVQWVVGAYALFLSSLLLVGGALGDRFGRRRIFLLGVVGFALASAGCGMASSPGWLIAARAVQGIAAALLVPGSLALLSASFEEKRRGRAIGTWSGVSAITASAGPLLGGWLIDHASWRWIFFLNLPLALTVLAIGLRFVPESRDSQALLDRQRGSVLGVRKTGDGTRHANSPRA
jgi:MFS family permease